MTSIDDDLEDDEQVEAMQFDGFNGDRVCEWSGIEEACTVIQMDGSRFLSIPDDDENHKMHVGDWIVRSESGSVYLCDRVTFLDAFYQPDEESKGEA